MSHVVGSSPTEVSSTDVLSAAVSSGVVGDTLRTPPSGVLTKGV